MANIISSNSISHSKTEVNYLTNRLDFNNFLLDVNNSDVNNRYLFIEYVLIKVRNVNQGATVSCTVSVFGKTYNVSYTADKATTDRSIACDIGSSIEYSEAINFLKQNSGVIPISVIAGNTGNFYSPDISISAEYILKDVATDFTLLSTDITSLIRVQLNTQAPSCCFDIKNAETDASLYTKTVNTNYFDIPIGTITSTNSSVKIVYYPAKVFNSTSIKITSYSSRVEKTVSSWTVSPPTITNLIYNGEYWENPITFSWLSTNQTGYEYELYSNNILVKTGVGGVEKSFSIPSKTFTSKLNNIVKVRVYREYSGIKYYSSWVESSLSLEDITSNISSLLVEGEYWEKPINVSWRSDYQQKFKIDVLKSNVVVKTYNGTTAKSYIIPANELSDGSHVIRVSVAYADRWVNSLEQSVTLKNIIPTLASLSLSGSNIDIDLTLSWESTDQQSFEVAIFKDEANVKTYNGTTAKSILIAHNQLTVGLHKFKVRVAYAGRFSDWKEISLTLIDTLPSIGVLEPDGVITERESITRIWWTSQNQSKWQLIIDGTTTFTGTNEKEKLLQPGALTTGYHSMSLTVWHVTSLGVEKTPVIKKSAWIVQGKPPMPTILGAGSYTSSRPIIQWDTQDQQGYVLEVLKDGTIIYTTDWQNGLISEQKINTYLENGLYTVRVKVMNQYSIESEYSSKEIIINATKPHAPVLKTLQFKNNVELTWTNPSNYTHFYVLRNDEIIAKVTGTSYIDYTCYSECIYMIRGITGTDVYQDSNKTFIECYIKEGIMCTVDALSDVINVGLSQNQYAFNGDIELESSELFLSGRELPVTVFGEHRTGNYNIEFTSKELFRFLEMCKRKSVFLYRDKYQKLFLTVKAPSYEFDALGTTYSISATEASYDEVIDYD